MFTLFACLSKQEETEPHTLLRKTKKACKDVADFCFNVGIPQCTNPKP